MDVETFEMIKVAIDESKKNHFESLGALRLWLLRLHPEKASAIEEAILVWTRYKSTSFREIQ
jgi:hypothetical protein